MKGAGIKKAISTKKAKSLLPKQKGLSKTIHPLIKTSTLLTKTLPGGNK